MCEKRRGKGCGKSCGKGVDKCYHRIAQHNKRQTDLEYNVKFEDELFLLSVRAFLLWFVSMSVGVLLFLYIVGIL